MKQLVVPFFGLSISAAGIVAIQTPAIAQEAAADLSTQAAPTPAASARAAPTQTDGRFIYSRDVPYGSAIGPRTPGQEHSVVTGPTNLLLSTMATGLRPLGDHENASIVAGSNSQVGLIGNRFALGMGALSSVTNSGSATSNNGSIQGSATGGAIGRATGVIRGAMGTLRGVLGGGQ